MEDSDLILARRLQEEFDQESSTFITSRDEPTCISGTESWSSLVTHSGALSVVDPSLEITDPNPDVRALFMHFNDEYFWGKLAGVEVRWSPRMTLCAGVCHYEGRGGLCSIRLSVPLLKLRPRKDLVETLLHEMIHAFLFVVDKDREREEHGPNFKKHMHRINKASGANITIYHSFHDEVDNYRQHWWRCNGPCQNRRPYFGWVKRAMNRAPSANDPWWEDHVRSCGGTYIKVKEPEGYGVKKKGTKEQKKDQDELKRTSQDIRSFLGNGNILGGATQNKGSKVSGSNKNVTSTVTSSGYPSSSSRIPSATATNDAHTSNTSSPKRIDTNKWGGGIWTPEKDDFSELSSNSHSRNDLQNTSNRWTFNGASSKETPASNPKNWTVVQTDKDKEMKPKPDSSDSKECQKLNSAGHVLGQGSGDGGSWLARIRKQWARENQTCSKSASSSVKNDPVTVPGQKDAGKCAGPADPQRETKVCAEVKPDTALTSSDSDSHHSSFHVSSCEEDNWPTPENFRPSKGKGSARKEVKRKRTVIELVSSDEDDFDFPAVSKRAKPVTEGNDSTGNQKHRSDEDISDRGGFTSETDASANGSGGSSSHSAGAPTSRSEGPVSLVSCPVCQRKVPSEDINGHLDICLS
ncbi:uncharacterized protein LOC143295930 [Babylonia areolata]|uniref:uncharacterized protein LOC143295930 n=1 Tax=Babylonia areolata TaxID=304850 RepID=UPI003FD29A94